MRKYVLIRLKINSKVKKAKVKQKELFLLRYHLNRSYWTSTCC